MILLPSCLEVQLQYFPLPSSKSVPSTRADYHQRFRAIGGPFARCLVTPIICSSHSISFLPSFPSFPPFLASPSSTLPIILLLIAGLIDRSIALLECTWHPNWRRAVGRGGTGRNSAQSRGTSHSPQLHAMQKCSGKTAPSIYTSCTRRNVDPPLATLARAPLCRPYVKAARKTVQTLVLQKGTCGFPPSMWKG